MARHILFTSQKGGVGKSTLARSTAVALADVGRKVRLADFDVEQRTCLSWYAQRQARRLEPTIAAAKFAKQSACRSGPLWGLQTFWVRFRAS
jgi:chromosome partitioning protein